MSRVIQPFPDLGSSLLMRLISKNIQPLMSWKKLLVSRPLLVNSLLFTVRSSISLENTWKRAKTSELKLNNIILLLLSSQRSSWGKLYSYTFFKRKDGLVLVLGQIDLQRKSIKKRFMQKELSLDRCFQWFINLGKINFITSQ